MLRVVWESQHLQLRARESNVGCAQSQLTPRPDLPRTSLHSDSRPRRYNTAAMGNSVGKILPSYPDRIWLEDVVAEGTFEHLLAPLPELSKEQLQRAAEKSRVPVDVPDPSLLERSATVWTESATRWALNMSLPVQFQATGVNQFYLHLHRRRQLTANYTALDWLSVFIPAIAWLRTYKWREWLVVSRATKSLWLWLACYTLHPQLGGAEVDSAWYTHGAPPLRACRRTSLPVSVWQSWSFPRRDGETPALRATLATCCPLEQRSCRVLQARCIAAVLVGADA